MVRVLDDPGQRIAEDRLGLLKRDTVLMRVDVRLDVIPFESDNLHTHIIWTKY